MWPYTLNVGVMALYYRISGILLNRTTGVGEILIAEGDNIEQSKTVDPACTYHNVGDLIQKVIAVSMDTSAIFITFISIAMTIQTSSA